MSSDTRDARRRRILEKGEDRLALITGRTPNLSSDAIDYNSDASFRTNLPSDQPSVSQTEEDKSSLFTDNQPSSFSQDDTILGSTIKEETSPFLRKPERVSELPSASASEDQSKGETSSGQKVLETALGVIQRIPLNNISSQQVGVAVSVMENDRLLCAITMAILIVLSSAGFVVLGSKIFRGILLFRPLFLVLITNITLIIRRLLPENRRKLVRGGKEANSSLLGDGYAWAEEAGRALELGLMLQNVIGALFMDCSVYATIVVFGLSLFG